MKKKNTFLVALLLQPILYCGEKCITTVLLPPKIQKERDELMKQWDKRFVEERQQVDTIITETQNAINFLEDLDLEAATPRIVDTSELQDGHVVIEYNTCLSAPEKLLAIATPTLPTKKHLPIAQRTPSMIIGETDSLEPYKKLVQQTSNSEKNPNQTKSLHTPISKSPEVSEKQPSIKKKSTTMIAIGLCTTVIALATLVYFLKNSIRNVKLFS